MNVFGSKGSTKFKLYSTYNFANFRMRQIAKFKLCKNRIFYFFFPFKRTRFFASQKNKQTCTFFLFLCAQCGPLLESILWERFFQAAGSLKWKRWISLAKQREAGEEKRFLGNTPQHRVCPTVLAFNRRFTGSTGACVLFTDTQASIG